MTLNEILRKLPPEQLAEAALLELSTGCKMKIEFNGEVVEPFKGYTENDYVEIMSYAKHMAKKAGMDEELCDMVDHYSAPKMMVVVTVERKVPRYMNANPHLN